MRPKPLLRPPRFTSRETPATTADCSHSGVSSPRPAPTAVVAGHQYCHAHSSLRPQLRRPNPYSDRDPKRDPPRPTPTPVTRGHDRDLNADADYLAVGPSPTPTPAPRAACNRRHLPVRSWWAVRFAIHGTELHRRLGGELLRRHADRSGQRRSFIPGAQCHPTHGEVPATTTLGQGFVDVQVVNTDKGFLRLQPGRGAAPGSSGGRHPEPSPASTGSPLAATSSDPNFATNNVETVVPQGSVVKLGGMRIRRRQRRGGGPVLRLPRRQGGPVLPQPW